MFSKNKKTKIILSDKQKYFFVFSFLLLTFFISSPALALKSGDINADSSVNLFDIQQSANVVAGNQTNPDMISRTDVNGDGSRDLFDIQLTANIAAGTAPTVEITSPANRTSREENAVVPLSFTITLYPEDNKGIAGAQAYYILGVQPEAQVDLTPPYEFTLDTTSQPPAPGESRKALIRTWDLAGNYYYRWQTLYPQ